MKYVKRWIVRRVKQLIKEVIEEHHKELWGNYPNGK